MARVYRLIAVSTAPPIVISGGPLADAVEGAAYSDTLTISGGTAPYELGTVTGVPSGLAASILGSTLTLSGTPAGGSAASSPYSLSIEVQDVEAATETHTQSLAVTAVAQGWNPSDKFSSIAISGANNITAAATEANWRGVRGVTARGSGSGKRYFEIGFSNYIDNNAICGVADAAASLSTFSTSQVRGINNLSSQTRLMNNGALTGTGTLPIWSSTRRMMAAYEPATGKLWLGVHGTWFNSGDPAAGTGATYTLTANTSLYPSAYLYSTCGVTYYGEAGAFAHSVPSGFTAWEG